jgi:hypothetical protein
MLSTMTIIHWHCELARAVLEMLLYVPDPVVYLPLC